MQFDFQLTPGASQTIDVKGRFFKYKSGYGLIRVRTSVGGYVDVLPGQGIENVNFTSLTISDRSGANNAGTILAGDFDFRDDRITGTVDMVDGGKARTLAGQAFMCWNNVAANAGGRVAHQIYNPEGSGKNLVIEQLQMSAPVDAYLGVGFINSALSADIGPATSKCSNGPLSTAIRRWTYMTDFSAVATIYTSQVKAGVNTERKFNEPLVVRPGWGVLVFAGANNVEVAAGFEWFEELV